MPKEELHEILDGIEYKQDEIDIVNKKIGEIML